MSGFAAFFLLLLFSVVFVTLVGFIFHLFHKRGKGKPKKKEWLYHSLAFGACNAVCIFLLLYVLVTDMGLLNWKAVFFVPLPISLGIALMSTIFWSILTIYGSWKLFD